MKIESYEFGRIVIDSKTYRSDVIIYPEKVDSSWWRIEGHLLSIADLSEVIKYKPDVIIIGTGAYGVMEVQNEVLEYLSKKNIEVQINKTDSACKIYNQLQKTRKTVACLHLTC